MNETILAIAGRHYYRATLPRRITASLIDLAIVFALALFLPPDLAFIVTLFFSIPYMLMGSGLLRGATIGKRILRLRVLDTRHGVPVTPFQEFIRHHYFCTLNPICLLLDARNSPKTGWESQETCAVVTLKPVSPAGLGALPEKPAKLDLESMRASMKYLDKK